jgi:hypothetical protein
MVVGAGDFARLHCLLGEGQQTAAKQYIGKAPGFNCLTQLWRFYCLKRSSVR